MMAISVLASLLISLLPFFVLWAVVVHGPIRSRWWRSETSWGFAAFVGAITFLLGFFGPLPITPEANQGPLLGIFITGPLGFVFGWIWGLMRQRSRSNPRASWR